MSRTFAYCRVSTTDQTTDNQIEEIRKAGFHVEPRHTVAESVSGSQAAALRPGFSQLLIKLDQGDILVVTKLDRLGRSAHDVTATVQKLEAMGVKVHCLALGGADLTSAAGKLVMGIIAHVAEFELDLIKERTRAGLERAVSDGKKLGRPSALSADQAAQACALLADGVSVSAVAKRFDVARATILRAKEAGTTA